MIDTSEIVTNTSGGISAATASADDRSNLFVRLNRHRRGIQQKQERRIAGEEPVRDGYCVINSHRCQEEEAGEFLFPLTAGKVAQKYKPA